MKRKILLLAGSAVVSLLVAEVVLRLFLPYPQRQLMMPDSVLGRRMRPNLYTRFVARDTPRRGVQVRTNSLGFHDTEWTQQNPLGVRRVIVLGDSFTAALQVPNEQAFHSVLERNIHQTEFLNFGISGFGTRRERMCYQRHGARFEHDAVLIVVFAENDPQDNVTTFSTTAPFSRASRIADHSALLQVLHRWYRTIRFMGGGRGQRVDKEAGWKVLLREIETIRAIAAPRPVLVAVIGTEKDFKRMVPGAVHIDDGSHPEWRGVPAGSGGHWNEAGHRAVAEKLKPVIEEALK